MPNVDLRSDTFTLPDDGMRAVIRAAEVGNAGFGEDPSVNRLQDTIADYFGMEAGLFLPSATMAGQIAFKVWTRPGEFIIIEEFGHGYYFESGAMAAISGALPRLLAGDRGILDAEAVSGAIEPLADHFARAALAVIENTANYGGGTVYPQAVLDGLFGLSRAERLPIHVDGARIWNAIIASGADPKDLVPPGGSMSVCFSKGLGAPMGALLLGSRDFIVEAHRIQAMLGGVMRQVGFMAAAALYSFEHNLARLAEDHANARLIADAIAGHPAVALDPAHVETNILYFRVRAGEARAARLIADLARHGVKAWNLGDLVRIVTSLNVDRPDCEYAAEKINALLD
jgi:threonine aldolase